MTKARAMILAAGFGTRLGELTRLRPKPMLPVCGAPLVRWAARWLAHHGVRDAVVNLHHMGEQIEAELGDGSDLGLSIQYSHEEGMILGTGGGLRKARPMLDPGDGTPIVVVNGKVLMDLDLDALLERHRSSGAEATMVLRQDEDMSRWGTPLHMDRDDGRLVSLLGEELENASPAPPMMFTGVHVFQPHFLDRIPPEGEQCVIRTAYRELFRERGVFAHETDGYWWEHSTPERCIQGVANVLDGKARLEYAPGQVRGVDPGARVDPAATIVDPVWIGPGAHVEAGATVGPHVQLGAGARVREGRTVRRSILWEGAEAAEDLEDRVIPA